MRAGIVLALAIVSAGAVCADDKPQPLAPCVQRLVVVDEKAAVEALAAVRAAGIAVVPDVRRAIKLHAGNEMRWLRLRRALVHLTEDWQRSKTPQGMVYVPAGKVEVPRSSSPYGPSGGRTDVAAFYIDRTETTVQEWRVWCAALDAREERTDRWDGPDIADDVDERLPIGEVPQAAAARYAREHRKGRLPTALEFERALRGSGLRTYPWGDEMKPGCANLAGGPGRAVPVGSYPRGASPFGVLDLVGNLAEWTSTTVPYGTVGTRPLVLGGSYEQEFERGLTWRSRARPRNIHSSWASAAWVGFRVARSAPPLPE